MADTLEIILAVPEALRDSCVADLTEEGFEGFWEDDDDRLRAYLPAAEWTDRRRDRLEAWLAAHGLPAAMDVCSVEEQDWETAWRDGYAPVTAGRFLIRPTWADTAEVAPGQEVITIDPKMSFGTGRHETTRLMLRLMERHVPVAGPVLDAGSGSGILAVAAVRLGADRVVAFDIDPATRRDAAENFARNGVPPEAVSFRIGAVEVVPETDFSLILANIVTPVLLELLPDFVRRLAPGGALLLSGITRDERVAVEAAATACGLRLDAGLAEADWWAGDFR